MTLRFLERLRLALELPSHPPAAPQAGQNPSADLTAQIAAAQSADFYSAAYFDPPEGAGAAHASGYAGYTAQEPGVAAAIHIALTYFHPRRALDVGCAKGYVVEGLRRRGVDARGIDFSRYAIAAAPENVRAYVAVGDATMIQFPADHFDLVICNETLEHLPPERVSVAISELYRITADKLWVTTPSMGQNDFGPPDGWPQSKIREDALPRYLSNPHHPDPAPPTDLMLDKDGYPIHGHLTIASYRWWTERFTACGFVRCGDIETKMNREEPLLKDGLWNGYVLEKPRLGVDGAQEVADRQAVAERVAGQQFVGNTELSVAGPKHPERNLWSAAQMSPSTFCISGLSLPPGQYEAGFVISVTPTDATTNEHALVAVIDIRSSSGQKIHALRTLRLRDFAQQCDQRITLRFGSSGESDFEFRVQPTGACSVCIEPQLAFAVAPNPGG